MKSVEMFSMHFTGRIMILQVTVTVVNVTGGEKGIRTPEGFHLNGFQDRRNRPLCHLSR